MKCPTKKWPAPGEPLVAAMKTGQRSDRCSNRLAYFGRIALAAQVRLEQIGDSLEAKGGVVWTSAQSLVDCLADAAIDERVDFSNKRVVELGAGTGAVGLWVAARWPTSIVVITDLVEAVPLMQR